MIHVVVCGFEPSLMERCMTSINMQSFINKAVYVSLDSPSSRKYLVRNTWDTVGLLEAADEDILAFADADDFLIDEDALQIVNDTYAQNPTCLLTYGSYVNLSSNKRGKYCGQYQNDENPRVSPWRASHLKTCKMKLWKTLKVSDLTWPDGTWFKCCADRAIMIPLMERAGMENTQYIDHLLYCYDDTNPQSVWRTMKEESLRTRAFIMSKGRE